jgi:Mg-chelatase subunit ChlD
MSVHLIFLIDSSSSIFDSAKDIMNVVNKCIHSQRDKHKEDRVSILTFSDIIKVVVYDEFISKFSEFKDFKPYGITYLYDSIWSTINGSLKMTRSRTDQTPFLIVITDGADYGSERFCEEQIRRAVKEAESKERWNFIYLTTEKKEYKKNKEGGGMGIENTTIFDILTGLEPALKSVSTAIDHYRKSGEVGNVDELNDLFNSSMKLDD